MATRKVKRYDYGGMTDEFGDLEGAIDAANTRAVLDQFEANEAANAEEVKKPSAQKLRSVGDSLINKARNEARAEAKAAPMSNYSNEGRRPIRAATTTRNILEEAKEEARRRRAGAEAMAPKREAPGRFAGKGPGLGALSNMKKGGAVKSSASSRADGIASKGKTRGKIC